MTIGEQLLPASFRGVSFLVPSSSATGGKKVAVHEYPGTRRRFVEELGSLEPVFEIPATVSGLDAIQKSDRLRFALNASGPGELVHPYRGTQLVVATAFTEITTDEELGAVRFSITFQVTTPRVSLTPVAFGKSRVFQAAANARIQLDVAATNRYPPLTLADNVTSVASRFGGYISSLQSQVSSVTNTVRDPVAAFSQEVTRSREKIVSIVRTPQTIVTAFRALQDSALAVVSTPSDMLREWRNLTGFGSADAEFKTGAIRTALDRTTKKRIDLDNALNTLDQSIRVDALINLFEASGDAQFETDTSIIDARSFLSGVFDRVVINQDDILASSTLGDAVLSSVTVQQSGADTEDLAAFRNGLAFDDGLVGSLLDLKDEVFRTLDENLKNAWRVEEIDLITTDIVLATYTLFGSLDNLEIMKQLNADRNLSFMRGDIKTVQT